VLGFFTVNESVQFYGSMESLDSIVLAARDLELHRIESDQEQVE